MTGVSTTKQVGSLSLWRSNK